MFLGGFICGVLGVYLFAWIYTKVERKRKERQKESAETVEAVPELGENEKGVESNG